MRSMDKALEDAARVSGASTATTFFRVTLPVMAPAIAMVLALQLLRIFDGFETHGRGGR